MEFPIATGKFTMARQSRKGFTLVELLVVMVIVATLLSIAAPRFTRSADDAREAALKADLRTLREAIDHYHADRGIYPEALADLVDKHYLRAIPIDPITNSADTWIPISPPSPVMQQPSGSSANPPSVASTSGIFDVRSGANGSTRDGQTFQNL